MLSRALRVLTDSATPSIEWDRQIRSHCARNSTECARRAIGARREHFARRQSGRAKIRSRRHKAQKAGHTSRRRTQCGRSETPAACGKSQNQSPPSQGDLPAGGAAWTVGKRGQEVNRSIMPLFAEYRGQLRPHYVGCQRTPHLDLTRLVNRSWQWHGGR
jgi:hypothetical protein